MKFEQLPVGPDTHCWDDDTGRDCWSYSPELVAKMLKDERKRAIADVLAGQVYANERYRLIEEAQKIRRGGAKK